MKKISLYIMLAVVAAIMASCEADNSSDILDGVWRSNSNLLYKDGVAVKSYYIFTFEDNTFREIDIDDGYYSTIQMFKNVTCYGGAYTFENDTINLIYSKDIFVHENILNEALNEAISEEDKENLIKLFTAEKKERLEYYLGNTVSIRVDSLKPKKDFIIDFNGNPLQFNYKGETNDFEELFENELSDHAE